MTNEERETIEDLGFSITSDDGKEVELNIYDPSGGDFLVCLDYPLQASAMDYYNGYDVDDEVLTYLEAKRNGLSGVPHVRELLSAIEWREMKLKELAFAL